MCSLGVTWADIGCPLGVVGGLRGGLGRLGGAMGGAEIAKYSYLRSKNTPCNQVNGCKYPPGMHQGCTKDAPGMHQGCSE